MASILAIGKRWRAQVRIKGRSIAKTFRTKSEAERWARTMEIEVESGNASALKKDLATLIADYRIVREESGRPIGPTTNEHYMLKRLTLKLGDKIAAQLTTQDIVSYAQARRTEDGVGGYTVEMELSKLGTVLRHMAGMLDANIPDAVTKARPMLKHLHLVEGGKTRERRPTGAELTSILLWFSDNPQYGLPMVDIVTVLLRSGFRRGELFRITWDDLDEAARMVMVRDRKHPRQKKGNDEWVPLIAEAFEIVTRQPRIDKRIFPFEPGTASKYFKWACDASKIVDLHMHDLRHEAASALFEAGWEIPEVAAVTGHKDWRNLKRYTNLKPEDIAEKGRVIIFPNKAA